MDAEMTNSEQPAAKGIAAASTASQSAPQVRSRITVVCAECKRLKLKCDRRNPCGSCTKRDTVTRCVYSPAAAEKVDLHSLNNRLMQVEATLAQLTSGQFVPSYPLSLSHHPPPSGSSSTAIPASQQSAYVEAVTGSSLAFPLQDVASLWADDLGSEFLPGTESNSPGSKAGVKVEPASVTITHSPFSEEDIASSSSLPSINIYYNLPSTPQSSPSASQRPCVSKALLELLPPSASSQQSTTTSPHTLQNLLHLAENSVVHTYPSLNWKHLRSRAVKMLSPLSDQAREKRAKAMEIFFGQRPSSADELQNTNEESIPFFAAVCAALALGSSAVALSELSGDAKPLDPTMNGRKSKTRKSVVPPTPAAVPSTSSYAPPSPAYWYALSVQALSVYEGSSIGTLSSLASAPDYDLDYLEACLLQVIFLLKHGHIVENTHGMQGAVDGKGTEGVVFPLVGKMVNIARQIGLTRDPGENGSSPSRKGKSKTNDVPISSKERFSLFESEMRRRIWWDVVYYDLFVSDAMGHPPLIPDKSFSTKLPVTDVDDKAFCPSSAQIPLPRVEDSMGYMKDGFQYFEIKCRLAELVRSIKRRMACPEPLISQLGFNSHPPGTYTIDQAALMESEVTAWLSRLPQCFRFDSDTVTSFGSGTESILAAQRCEIALTAHRLILKIYLPFLKKKSAATFASPPYQAIVGAANAAHAIIQALQALVALWNTQRDGNSRHPAMFNFYSLPRILFDAAVVCAHAGIKNPSAMWAATAAADVNAAIDLLKEDSVWRVSGGLGVTKRHELQQSDAIHIVEELRNKMQLKVACSTIPLKRKLDELEQVQNQPEGLYKDHRSNLTPDKEMVGTDESRTTSSPSVRESRLRMQPPERQDKKHKKVSYPPVGIRVRPGKESVLLSSRSSVSTIDGLPKQPASTKHGDIIMTSSFAPGDLQHVQSFDNQETSSSSPPGHATHRSRSSSMSQDPRPELPDNHIMSSSGFEQNHSVYDDSPMLYDYSTLTTHPVMTAGDHNLPDYPPHSPYTTGTTSSRSSVSSPYTNTGTPAFAAHPSHTYSQAKSSQPYYATPSYDYSNHSVNTPYPSGQAVGLEPDQSMGQISTHHPSFENMTHPSLMNYPPTTVPETWSSMSHSSPEYWTQPEFRNYS